MLADRRFQINTPDVVYEIIEGEAVIVNLSNGMYYSVDRAGADIWELLQDGASLTNIVAALGRRYSGAAEAIEAGVQQFIDQLQAESLIALTDSEPVVAETLGAQDTTPDAYKPRFEVPALQRYTDMEDLLLLDPVHTADEEEVSLLPNA